MKKTSDTSYIVVTGAAGFIGSNVVAMLNRKGIKNLIIVDHMTEKKKKNIHGLQFDAYFEKKAFLKKIEENSLPKITAIIHLGACSDTREYDKKYLQENNYVYSQKLFAYAVEHTCQFIYASSGAVYGNGKKGYVETTKGLRPLNPYGYFKYSFDTWVLVRKIKPHQWVGLRFFNVYGPNEDHKGPMASVVYHGYHQIQKTGKMDLFTSHNKKYADGMQLRDFVYVQDVGAVILFFLKHHEKSGIFNVGTGQARSFLDLAKATFHALHLPANISFISMPPELRRKYQYYTEANISALRKIGFTQPFTPLEKGVKEYVTYLLLPQNI